MLRKNNNKGEKKGIKLLSEKDIFYGTKEYEKSIESEVAADRDGNL